MNEIDRTRKIMDYTNFSIEGMTVEILENEIQDRIKNNPNLEDIFIRNQSKFILKCFSSFLQNEGRYIEGTHLKDLMILYYIDYYLKDKLSYRAIKVDNYLKIALMSGMEKGIITKELKKNENTFGQIMGFFEGLSSKQKEYVKNFMEEYYETSFDSVKEFQKHMQNIVSLRNLGLHHCSIVSEFYGFKMKNGKVISEEKHKGKTLSQAIESLCYFLNVKSSQKIIKKVTRIYEKYDFSNIEIKKYVWNKAKEVMNFKALENVSTENIHFSIIDLIKDDYNHSKDIK